MGEQMGLEVRFPAVWDQAQVVRVLIEQAFGLDVFLNRYCDGPNGSAQGAANGLSPEAVRITGPEQAEVQLSYTAVMSSGCADWEARENQQITLTLSKDPATGKLRLQGPALPEEPSPFDEF